MALIICKECKQQVSSTAEKCPSCGAKVPKKLSVVHWIGIGFLGLAFWAIFAADNKSSTSSSAASAPSTPTQPALSVSSTELARAYEQNEAAADALYKNKVIQVTGVVTDITKDFTDNTVVMLRGVNEFLGVHAELEESEEQKAISLSKGESVVVLCRGGGEVISSPMLRGCRFQ